MKKVNNYLFLHLLLLLLSFSSVFSKMASQNSFLSFKFCLFYMIALMILGIYAIMWQQVLKKFTLTSAFLNKSITIIWGMIWGFIFFKEAITVNMIIGAIFVFVGISLVVKEIE